MSNYIELGFLAFLRLVGTVYFKRFATAFSGSSPQTLFLKYIDASKPPLTQHSLWLEDIRQSIWDRTQFEEEMIPSIDALQRHWKRVCWVIDMWGQADHPSLNLKPMTKYGWKESDGHMINEWDSDANMATVRNRVAALLKGCKCRTGCKSAICGCRKRGNLCSEGCDCTACANTVKEDSEDEDDELNREVDEVMDWVFGGD